MQAHPMVKFRCITDDPATLKTTIQGVVKNSTVGALGRELWVTAYDLTDATMVRVAASDEIKGETHFLTDELKDDEDTGTYAWKHRVDGPAETLRQSTGTLRKWWLFDHRLAEEDHAEAVAKGLHDDQDAFKVWYRKIERSYRNRA